MADSMVFPNDWAKFLEDYSFRDHKEFYTNGARLIPTFRVEQMMHHYLRKAVADFVTENNFGHRWIPVTERLPEIASIHKMRRHMYKKSIRVLCVCVQKDGKTMVKEGYCEVWDDYPEPIWKIPGTIDSVTHWMPLPEPPKEEK